MARTLRSLPIVSSHHSLVQVMQTWRAALGAVIISPNAPAVPWNFAVTAERGALQLSWARVDGADGYEILRDPTGEFLAPQIITIDNVQQTNYRDSFDAVTTMYYKLRATSGTQQQKHIVLGNETATVSGTSIDSSDTTTPPTTNYDKGTTQGSSVFGSYNGFGKQFNNLSQFE